MLIVNKRYTLREFGGAVAIKDNAPDAYPVLFGIGSGVDRTFQEHRIFYTKDDAQAVCDWLNERDAGYPVSWVAQTQDFFYKTS